jgi:hypothetical protein
MRKLQNKASLFSLLLAKASALIQALFFMRFAIKGLKAYLLPDTEGGGSPFKRTFDLTISFQKPRN